MNLGVGLSPGIRTPAMTWPDTDQLSDRGRYEVKDPFAFTEKGKIAALLARVLYLKGCINNKVKPLADPLHAGAANKATAWTCVNLLGYDEKQTHIDLLEEIALLTDCANKNEKIGA